MIDMEYSDSNWAHKALRLMDERERLEKVPSDIGDQKAEIARLKDVLADLLGQIDSCDGTAQLNTEQAEAALRNDLPKIGISSSKG